MILSILSIVALAVTGLYMLQTARGKVARRLAVLPLMMCVCEFVMMSVIEAGAFPILTIALMACRTTVIVLCSLVVKKDAQMARAHNRARQQLRRGLKEALSEQTAERKIVAFRRCA